MSLSSAFASQVMILLICVLHTVLFPLLTTAFPLSTFSSYPVSVQRTRSVLQKPRLFAQNQLSNREDLNNDNLQNDHTFLTQLPPGVRNPSELWHFIDRVYLITTDQSSKERFAQTQSVLTNLQLWDKVIVKTFTADNENRVRGCYQSHMQVLQEVQDEYRKLKSNSFVALILEDNLEITPNFQWSVLQAVERFLDLTAKNNKNNNNHVNICEVIHLAYMMYVPGIRLRQVSRFDIPSMTSCFRDLSSKPAFTNNIVQLLVSNPTSAAVGTSAYLITDSGVDKLLNYHNNNGEKNNHSNTNSNTNNGIINEQPHQGGFRNVAIPNVMAEVFPQTRYAAYPMLFHRAGKVSSLVNPQLDDFRKIVFQPAVYSLWEKLMVATALENNQLFPALLVSLTALLGTSLYHVVLHVVATAAASL